MKGKHVITHYFTTFNTFFCLVKSQIILLIFKSMNLMGFDTSFVFSKIKKNIQKKKSFVFFSFKYVLMHWFFYFYFL